jgi:hypothetical protein
MTIRHPAPDPVELVLEFGEGNADRNCKYCEGAADAYILSSQGTDGEDVSACVCEGHVDKAVSIITRGEYDTLPDSDYGCEVLEDDSDQATLGGFTGVTS